MLRINSRNGLMESTSASRNLGEIMQLKKRLKDQLAVRRALEKALGYRTTFIDSSSSDSFIPIPAKELIREISVLELEIMNLEQYLLSLYRRAFDHQKPPKERFREPISCQRMLFQDPEPEISSKKNPAVNSTRILPSQMSANKLADESCCESVGDLEFRRSHSVRNHGAVDSSRISASQAPPPLLFPKDGHGANSTRILPSQMSAKKLADESCCESLGDLEFLRRHSVRNHGAVDSSRISPSQAPPPLLFPKDGHGADSGVISLAEYLGTSIADHVPETPNKISEDMVRCMGSIYSKVAESALNPNPDPASSPTSSLSSMSASSPQYIGDMWSPGCKNQSNLSTRLINPFHIEGLEEFSGPYNAMVEVSSISRDRQRLKIVEDLLNTYESLVQKLATVDVRRMKNDEKMAFWINLHNALMMHAYLVHGVPQTSIKRSSLLIKATCIVGGHSIDAKMIQASILGCCTHFSGQWLQTFKHPRIKLKSRAERRRRNYAIEKKEPLLRFALCSGTHSDPAVRIYSAKRLYQQLETAKEEYIRATVGVQRENKILLPELVESYAKDISASSQKVVDMIQSHLPEAMRIQRCRRGRSQRIIEWVPHKFSFRYLFASEVANPQII